MNKDTKKKAIKIAASCWCQAETSNIEMAVQLGSAVAGELALLLERIEKLERSEEAAWGLIANAYGGNWELGKASGWKAAAERWRDAYHTILPPLCSEQAESP